MRPFSQRDLPSNYGSKVAPYQQLKESQWKTVETQCVEDNASIGVQNVSRACQVIVEEVENI